MARSCRAIKLIEGLGIAVDTTTRKLVDFAVNLGYEDLTPQTVHAVRRILIDAAGCAIGAFHAQPIKAVHAMAAEISSKRPATVIGTRITTSAEMAGFANGCMIRYADFSDDYFGGNGDTGPHPSDNVGSLLAAAEIAGADGKTLILSVVIAYEACCRMVDESTLRAQGWDYPILHSIATALAAGKVLGLSHVQMCNALALAVAPNICLAQTRRSDLSNWKGFAGPNGSRNGLFAALLAEKGITGPSRPFDGTAGFMKQLHQAYKLDTLGGTGSPFKVEGVFLKYLPVRYTAQLLVWAALELRSRIALQDVESICVYLESRSVVTPADSPEYWDPRSRETADHSYPYLVAAALMDGEITAETFSPRRYRDPTLLPLLARIRMKGDPAYTDSFPRQFHCRIEAQLRSGKVVTVHQSNPKGHPANPLSDHEIENKFMRQVQGVIAQEQARALLNQMWQLETLDGMRNMFSLMTVPES